MKSAALAIWIFLPCSAIAQGYVLHNGIPVRNLPVAVMPTSPPLPAEPSVAVVSAGTPSLNGSYGITATAVNDMTAIVAGIGAGQGFPGGAETLTWLDTAGAPHTFATTAEFVAFAKAIEAYVYETQLASMGQASTLPAVPLQIP